MLNLEAPAATLRPPVELREIMAGAVEHGCVVTAAGSIFPVGKLTTILSEGIVKSVMTYAHARGDHTEGLAQRAGLVGKITGYCEGKGIEVSAEQKAAIVAMADPDALLALLTTLRQTGAFPPEFPADPAAPPATDPAAPPPQAAQDPAAPDLEQTKAAVLIAQMVGFCDAAGIDFPQEKRLQMQGKSVDELVALYAALKVARSFPADLDTHP